jgi:archaellum component FlaC
MTDELPDKTIDELGDDETGYLTNEDDLDEAITEIEDYIDEIEESLSKLREVKEGSMKILFTAQEFRNGDITLQKLHDRVEYIEDEYPDGVSL